MRLLAATSLFLALITSIAAAQNDAVVVSERLGPSIDSLEREYFGLFPGCESFTSAVSRRTPIGELQFVISRRGNTDTIITLTADVARDIRHYVEHFEEYQTDELAYIHDPSRPYRLHARLHSDVISRFELLDGRVVEGSILHLDQRGVVVLPGDGVYDWRKVEGSSVVIHAQSIDRIIAGGAISMGIVTGVSVAGTLGTFAFVFDRGDRPGILPVGLSAVFGGVLGGYIASAFAAEHTIAGQELLFGTTLPTLMDYRMFVDAQPPEVLRKVETAFGLPVHNELDERLPGTPATLDFDEHATSRLSIALSLSAPASNQSSVYTIMAARGPRVDTSRAFLTGIGVGLEAAYDLAPWLDAALSLDYRFAPPSSEIREQEEVSELNLTAMIEFNLTPRRTLGRQPMELLIGAGGGVARLDLHATVRTPDSAGVQDGFMVSTVPVAIGRMSVRFALGEFSAFQLGFVGRWYPTLDIPDYGYIYPTTLETGRKVPSHQINLSGVQAQIGLRRWF